MINELKKVYYSHNQSPQSFKVKITSIILFEKSSSEILRSLTTASSNKKSLFQNLSKSVFSTNFPARNRRRYNKNPLHR